MRRRDVVLAMLVGWCGGACATSQDARLYAMANGGASSVSVRNARGESGTLNGALPTGEPCTGTFTTRGPVVPVLAARAGITVGKAAELGSASVRCGADVVLACGLARRPGHGFAYGACKDAHGNEWVLVFDGSSS